MDGYIDIVILIDTHEINSEGDSLMSKNKTMKKRKKRKPSIAALHILFHSSGGQKRPL